MATTRAGGAFYVDTSGFNRLARNLRAAAPQSFKAAQKSIRAVALVVAEDAKARAPLPEIADVIKTRMSGLNARVRAQGEVPVIFEIGSKGTRGTIRHPVLNSAGSPKREGTSGKFHYDRAKVGWASMPARPYLYPALEAHRAEAEAAVEDAVAYAVERAVGDL
jgi:hypothetical protein